MTKPDGVPQVAVVGAGYWGKNLVRNFFELNALGAVCDSRAEILSRIKADFGGCPTTASFEDVLNDKTLAAVAIAAPAESHAKMVEAALIAGKDVFVEKPLALSVAEGEKLVTLARAHGRILMVGHLLWYHPAILKLKALVKAGELGKIRYVYSNRLNLGKIRREENILWSFAPHDISVILGLLEEMPTSVYAEGGNYLHERIADTTLSLLSFASGVKAHIYVSWLHPFKEQKLVIVGEKKMAVFDDVEKVHKLVLYPHTIDWDGEVPVAKKAQGCPIDLEEREPLKDELAHFLDCIVTRKAPLTDGEEGLRVLRVLESCQTWLTKD